jgi:hypothetical protein
MANEGAGSMGSMGMSQKSDWLCDINLDTRVSSALNADNYLCRDEGVWIPGGV